MAYLVYWLVILLLLGQAVTSVLRPPDGVLAVGLVAGLVCLRVGDVLPDAWASCGAPGPTVPTLPRPGGSSWSPPQGA